MTEAISLFHAQRSAQAERAMIDVFRSGQIAAGPHVSAFEVRMAELVDVPNLIATNDMTSAMSIALALVGVTSGDEVVTAPFTCLSSTSPILLAGARVRWADIDPATGNMTAATLAEAITRRTRAVVLYHAVGYPADAAAIAALCASAGIPLIEDCNTSMGATLGDRQVGSFGACAVFSYYPNRQVNALEGGAVSTRSSELAARARRLRRFALDMSRFRLANGEINPKADVAEPGWAASMSNLNAAVGVAHASDFPGRLAATRENARWLADELAMIRGLAVVPTATASDPAYWALLVQSDERDGLLAEIKRRGVLSSKIHHRNDLYSAFAHDDRKLPGTEMFTGRTFGIPCGWWLSPDDLARVADVVRSSADSLTRIAKIR